MSNATNETALVRISAETHAMLREMATAQRRTIGGQAEVLIENAYHVVTQSNAPVAQARPTHAYPQVFPVGG